MDKQRQHSWRYLPDLTQQYFNSTSAVFLLLSNVAYANYLGRSGLCVVFVGFLVSGRLVRGNTREKGNPVKSFRKTYKPKECQITRRCHRMLAVIGRSRVSISHRRSVTCVKMTELWTGRLESGLPSGLWT